MSRLESFRASSLARRIRVVSWASSCLGFGLGVVLSRTVPTAARPGQLPGFAAAHGFSPTGYLLRLLVLVATPLALSLLAVGVARARARRRGGDPDPRGVPSERLGAARGRPTSLRGLYLPAVAAHAICVWTLLVATPGVGVGAAARLSPFPSLAGLLLASAVLAAVLGGEELDAGAVFLSGSVVALPLAFWQTRPASVSLAAAAAALGLPVVLRLLARSAPRPRRFLARLTAFVFLPAALTAFAAVTTMRTSLADLFEDGHSLLPASEYLRGELPYRDVVPGHGLLSDGLAQFGLLRVFGDDYRGVHLANETMGALFWPSIYAVGLAATGSAALAFGGGLLSFICFPQYFYLRVMPALWVLAAAVYAARTGRRRGWLACGAALPLAVCTGVEFGAYSAVAALVALLTARGSRRLAFRWLARGAAAASLAVLVAMTLARILVGFLKTTLLYLPSLMPAYALPLVRPSLPSRLADFVPHLADRTNFLYGFVALSIVVLAAHLPRAPVVGPRGRAALPLLAWIVCAMVSVVERRHIGYPFFLIPVALLLILRWCAGVRSWPSARALFAASAFLLVLFLWRPVRVIRALADQAASSRPPPGYSPVAQPPRARGASFAGADVSLIEATADLIRRGGFSAADTWFDFANAPGLYFLFDRDCPIRYYEVPFFESASAQAEVIAALERNPRVRAVLVSTGLRSETIDGIPNPVRAPLVAAYLRRNFRPGFRRGPVEFWLRTSIDDR